ncbi:MAG: hypothetical protein JWR11_45 [Mycobacterium sp.]|nr:hypothetical protein [Mycobacterium sp.]
MDGAKGLTRGEISAHFAESCDGLTGLPEVVGNVWPLAIVQTYIFTCCATHFVSRSAINWDEIKRDLKPIYTAVNVTAACGVRRADREMGAALPGDHPIVGQRLERVHPLPGLRRGDPAGDLLDDAIESLNAR